MISQQSFAVMSLELHIFFSRIMKEHAIFMEAGFTPKNAEEAAQADYYKQQFEAVLHKAVETGNGIISPNAIASGEIVTNYTWGAEEKTWGFTGIPIDQRITQLETRLQGMKDPRLHPELVQQVGHLNDSVIVLLDSLIKFKTRIYREVLSCQIFTALYPTFHEHILHEAQTYRSHLETLQSGRSPEADMKGSELFWDEIMMEHALQIKGMLDPNEKALISTADDFAKAYEKLLHMVKAANNGALGGITGTTLQETIDFRNFKESGVKGIAACRIRGIILPLLADHVLREANHYIRVLRWFESRG